MRQRASSHTEASPSVANNINHNILLEGGSPVSSNAAGLSDSFWVVCIHMQDWGPATGEILTCSNQQCCSYNLTSSKVAAKVLHDHMQDWAPATDGILACSTPALNIQFVFILLTSCSFLTGIYCIPNKTKVGKSNVKAAATKRQQQLLQHKGGIPFQLRMHSA